MTNTTANDLIEAYVHNQRHLTEDLGLPHRGDETNADAARSAIRAEIALVIRAFAAHADDLSDANCLARCADAVERNEIPDPDGARP